MNCGQAIRAAITAAVPIGSSFATVATGPTEVHVSAAETVLWECVTESRTVLKGYFPEGAVRAELTIQPLLRKGTCVSQTLTPAAPTYEWCPFEGTSPARDEIYETTLTYYDATDKAVASSVAQLAVVRGAFGACRIVTDATSDEWRKRMGEVGDSAVALACDSGWFDSGDTVGLLEIAAGGNEAEFPLAGLSGWHVFDFRPRSQWKRGEYAVKLTSGGKSITGSFEKIGLGLIMSVK